MTDAQALLQDTIFPDHFASFLASQGQPDKHQEQSIVQMHVPLSFAICSHCSSPKISKALQKRKTAPGLGTLTCRTMTWGSQRPVAEVDTVCLRLTKPQT